MGPDEYTRALGHVDGERTLDKKKKTGLWSGLKSMFHQRQRTASRLNLSQL